MASLPLRHILIFFWMLDAFFSSSQNSPDILHKKYAPEAIRRDLTLFKEVTLAMHPAIGLYENRAYYEHLFDTNIAEIHDSLSEKEFRIRCKLIADELHCGHTEVLSSKAYQKKISRLKLNYSPYIFYPVQNRMYVIANLAKKQDSTIRKGTEITRINGLEVDSMLRYCRRFISADGYNQTAKVHFIQLNFNNFFPSLFGRPDSFSVEYKEGKQLKEKTYTAMKVSAIPPLPLRPKEDSLFKRYKRAGIRYRYLDSTKAVMLIKIDKFSHVAYRKAYRKLFRRLEKEQITRLVLDLRNNGGGSLGNSYRLLRYLLDSAKTQLLQTRIKNYPYGRYTQGNLSFRFTRFVFGCIGKKVSRNDTDTYIYTIHPRKKHHYSNKIYVLINGGTFSASCLVGAYLKPMSRVTFIGEETGGAIEGCNAGVTPYYTLPATKIRVRMPAFRIIHTVSPQITKHGILPDYPTQYSFKDIAARRDMDLIKVKEVIKNK